VRLDGSNVTLYKYVNGRGISVAGPSGYSVGGTAASVWIKLSGTTIKVWVAGTLEINTTDSSIREGGLAFGGTAATFDNLKVGHDNNANDRINDAGDDLFVDEAFGSSSKSVVHDKAGNLVDDGAFWYKYDAWNRLVKVQQAADSGAITIQTAGYDGSGRRVKKVVTNSGDLDGTTKYLYQGWQIVETRDGSDNLVQQFIHGTQYIDELVMVRTTDKGELYYHQDANWNIIATSDLAGRVAERYVLTPYGEVTAHQERGYGDYDGDGDVDSTDYNAIAGACSGSSSGACRVLDVNNSGTVNSSDQTPHAALPQGLLRKPGLSATGLGQVFAHQGLPLDGEVGSYQNRAREYGPAMRRFVQRDPLSNSTTPPVGYADGMSLSFPLLGNPVSRVDPSGAVVWCWFGTCLVPKPIGGCSTMNDVGATANNTGFDVCGLCCWGTVTCTASFVCRAVPSTSGSGFSWVEVPGSFVAGPCL